MWTIVSFADQQILYDEEGIRAMQAYRLDLEDVVRKLNGRPCRFVRPTLRYQRDMEDAIAPMYLDEYPEGSLI